MNQITVLRVDGEEMTKPRNTKPSKELSSAFDVLLKGTKYEKPKMSFEYRCQQVYGLLLTEPPPIQMIIDYRNHTSEELQEWCCNHLKSDIEWSTGIGIIDVAEHLVIEAINNANIDEDGNER